MPFLLIKIKEIKSKIIKAHSIKINKGNRIMEMINKQINVNFNKNMIRRKTNKGEIIIRE